jgi:hypothetical protein
MLPICGMQTKVSHRKAENDHMLSPMFLEGQCSMKQTDSRWCVVHDASRGTYTPAPCGARLA